MTNNKISNLIKVVAVFVLLCGASAMPRAADGDRDIAIGFTFGIQVLSEIRAACDSWLDQEITGYVCDRAALAGGPYLRIGLAPHHSLMLAYRFSDEYEQTLKYSAGGVRTRPYSFLSPSIAYQYRLPLGGFDTEGFLKVGYHFTEFEWDDSAEGKYTDDVDGVLLGGGLVYEENFVLGYEYSDFDAEGDINGHAFYMGAEFSL